MVKHVLLLWHLIYLAWALPVQENSISASIVEDLLNLSKSCENSFVSEIIRDNYKYCNITPGLHQKNLDCILFYDINSQLCTTFGKSVTNLKTNYAKNIHLTSEVLTLCDEAKEWKLITPKYKAFFEQLFKNKLACFKVCTENDNTMSEDSNFFCKYFKWGTDVISTYVNQLSQATSSNVPPQPEAVDEVKSDISLLPNNEVTASQTSNIESQQIHKDVAEISTNSEINLKTDTIKQDTTKKSLSLPIVSTQEVTEKDTIKNEAIPEIKSPIKVTKTADDQPSKINIEEEVKKNEKEVDFNAVVDNPNQDLVDTNNDFGIDMDEDALSDADNTNDSNDLEPKIEKPVKENSNINKLPSFMDIPEREVYPVTIQDSFSEEDDHFFPFFLTAILLIVLLYILYHNKSRVTKLILGLIVEGRQTNRRRNSRGHAYRRLDTLEQAMSTNSPAPPSKIIY